MATKRRRRRNRKSRTRRGGSGTLRNRKAPIMSGNLFPEPTPIITDNYVTPMKIGPSDNPIFPPARKLDDFSIIQNKKINLDKIKSRYEDKEWEKALKGDQMEPWFKGGRRRRY
jgi:hypothetical protein